MKPLLLVVVLLVLILLLLSNQRLRSTIELHWAAVQKAVVIVSALLLAALTVAGLLCVATERIGFLDSVSVLSIAAAYRHGQPMYPGAHAPMEYSLLYGPATYLLLLPPMFLGLERAWTYQIWALSGLLASVVLLFLTLRRFASLAAAAGFTALLCLSIGALSQIEFGIKSDPWILCFISLGFWAVSAFRPWTAAIVVGLAGMVLIDLKATLFLVAVLPCLILIERKDATRLQGVAAAGLMVLGSFLPFALPRVSLSGYREVLHDAARHGISYQLVRVNTEYLLTLVVFLLALSWTAWRLNRAQFDQWLGQRRWYVVVLLLAGCTCALSGAKKGSGPWHCIPLVIPVLWASCQVWVLIRQAGSQAVLLRPKVAAPFCLVLLNLLVADYYSITYQIRLQTHDSNHMRASIPDVEKDMIHILDSHANERLQVGPADDWHQNLMTVKGLLYLRGTPLIWDEIARSDNFHAGLPMSEEALAPLRSCRVTMWIIPAGAEPFSRMSSASWTGSDDIGKSYPEAFRDIFFNKYRKVPSDSKYFDLWACHPG